MPRNHLVIMNSVGAKFVSLPNLYRLNCLFNVFTRRKRPVSEDLMISFKTGRPGDSLGIYEFVIWVIVTELYVFVLSSGTDLNH